MRIGPWRRFRRWWLQRRADIHLVSFPKCGRTWLVLMLAKVIEARYGLEIANPLKLRRYRTRIRELPLILQHHDGGPEFQKPEELAQEKLAYAGRKVIFLVRDPRDVLVSTYYQKAKRNYDFTGTLTDYVYQPVGGIHTIVEFYNIWARNRHIPTNFLLMRYESLHEDAERELRRAVDFIGIQGVTDQMISQAVEFCRFDNMRRLEATNEYRTGALAARNPEDDSTYKTRKGEVGGYREQLGEAEIAYVNSVIQTHLDPFFADYLR